MKLYIRSTRIEYDNTSEEVFNKMYTKIKQAVENISSQFPDLKLAVFRGAINDTIRVAIGLGSTYECGKYKLKIVNKPSSSISYAAVISPDNLVDPYTNTNIIEKLHDGSSFTIMLITIYQEYDSNQHRWSNYYASVDYPHTKRLNNITDISVDELESLLTKFTTKALSNLVKETDHALNDIQLINDYEASGVTSIQQLYNEAADHVINSDWNFNDYRDPWKAFGKATIRYIESHNRKLTSAEKKYCMEESKMMDFGG